MEQYKDFWISGHNTPGYPAGRNPTAGVSVLYQRPDNLVVELTTLNINNFAFEDHVVVKLMGLELASLIVDTCYREVCASGRKLSWLLSGKNGNRLSHVNKDPGLGGQPSARGS